MLYLRQSTASQDVSLGPFVDSTNGDDAETGLTINNTDIRIKKGNAAWGNKNSGGGTHEEDGFYEATFDATDTDTVGRLQVQVRVTGALPVYHEFHVLEENVYDAMFAASASLGTDITDILTDTGTTLDTKLNDIQGAGFSSATDSLEALRDRGDSAWTGSPTTSDSGTAQAGSSTTITLRAGASSSDNIHNGQLIYISGGTGAGQSKAIGDSPGYNGTTKVATIIGTWAVTPDNTSVYEIYPADIDEITDPPTALAIAQQTWQLSTAGNTPAGSFGEQCKNDIDAILSDTGTTLDAAIAALQSDVTDILNDTNELQADDFRTTIDNIETDTQDLQTQIGTAGDGLTAVPWNAAWDAEVESEVNDALIAANLDHLCLTPVGSADVVDNTIIAKLVSASATADWDDFVNTTDSLEALRAKQADIEADTQDIQGRLPAALIGGRMEANVEAINNVAITGDGSGTPFDV